MENRPFRTPQPRLAFLAVPPRTIEPCTASTHLHPGWSFDQVRVLKTDLTEPVRVLPNHLDKPMPTAESDLTWIVPDLTWIVRFPKMVHLTRTECSEDQADGLTLMSDSLLDFYHSDFSKARIIQLSEDLGRISTLLDQARDCPDRPAFVQLLTAATSTWTNESRHQLKSHIDQI